MPEQSLLSPVKNIAVNLYRLERRKFRRFRQLPTRKKLVVYSNFILPAVFFYDEVVFRLSTTGRLFRFSLILTLLFSILWGMAGYFLCTISRKPRINRRIKLTILGLTAVPFLVEYFVYRKFKTLYDLRTVMGGADDVAGGFMGDVFRMVFSLRGILHIILFLLPFGLYLAFGAHFDPARGSNARRRIKTVLLMLVTYLLTLLLVAIPPTYRNSYGKQYNFESAVSNFGFMTGLRLDVKKSLFGTKGSFNTTPAAVPSASPAAQMESSDEASPSPSPEAEKDYGYSVMDIDFEALAASASEEYAEIDEYVAGLTPSKKNQYTGLFEGKNLIFISAEAFSAEVIDPERTPTLYRLATKGIQVPDYFQPEIAGTTGGEYHNIFGLLTTDGGLSMETAVDNYNPLIISRQLNNLGYTGYAFHNNDYTYYSRDYTHNRLGFSEGFMGYGNGMEEFVDEVWPESDLQMMEGTVPMYLSKQPFNVYYMSVSGHSDYTFYDNMMAYQNWDLIQDDSLSEPVHGYLAANMEFEKAMTYLVDQLEKAGIADDTVIVISADHFPYGLDESGHGSYPYLSELYGFTVTNYIERDHNRLIIWSGCLEDMDPIVVDTPTHSLDLLPTLLNLFGLEWDSRLLPGRDILSEGQPLIYNNLYDWKTEKGTYISQTGKFTPADPNETVSQEYISSIHDIVENKVYFSSQILHTDYYAHVFNGAN